MELLKLFIVQEYDAIPRRHVAELAMPTLSGKESACTVDALPREVAEVEENYFLKESTAVGASGMVAGALGAGNRGHTNQAIRFDVYG
jgi:hypothetical protein